MHGAIVMALVIFRVDAVIIAYDIFAGWWLCSCRGFGSIAAFVVMSLVSVWLLPSRWWRCCRRGVGVIAVAVLVDMTRVEGCRCVVTFLVAVFYHTSKLLWGWARIASGGGGG